MKEAAIPSAFRLNGGNLHDTGHSTDPTPTVAMAEQQYYGRARKPCTAAASRRKYFASHPPQTGVYFTDIR
ncbi:MAG: hypothetical protein ABIK82_09875 [Pseudomonadota bacterium]